MKVVCSAVSTAETEEEEFVGWPAYGGRANSISPLRLRLYQQVIRRFVLWAVKYIDIQVDSLIAVVRDEEVRLCVPC